SPTPRLAPNRRRLSFLIPCPCFTSNTFSHPSHSLPSPPSTPSNLARFSLSPVPTTVMESSWTRTDIGFGFPDPDYPYIRFIPVQKALRSTSLPPPKSSLQLC